MCIYKFQAYTERPCSTVINAFEVSVRPGNHADNSTVGPSTVKMRYLWIRLSLTLGATRVFLDHSLHISTSSLYIFYLQRHILLWLWLDLNISQIADEGLRGIIYAFSINKNYLICRFFFLSFPFWV